MRPKHKFAHRIPFTADIEDIIYEVGKELNISVVDVRDIIDVQFKLLDKVVRENGKVKEDSEIDNYKSLRLAEFGSFRLSKPKFKRIKASIIKKKQNKDV